MMEDTAIEVPISAIEHYSYCPRQCALIHVEQTYDENQFTIRGRIAHERVDTGADQLTEGVQILRSVPLWSDRLGLIGRADVVEMRLEGPYPVEYKVGKSVSSHAALQLCAQALCLEEMTGSQVARGAIYCHGQRRRHEVQIDAALRRQTEEVIASVRAIIAGQQVPDAVNDSRCPNCSLVTACMPGVVGEPTRLRGLKGALFHPLQGTSEE